jgi:hypothetical protein
MQAVWDFMQENVLELQAALCLSGLCAEDIECVTDYLTGASGPIQMYLTDESADDVGAGGRLKGVPDMIYFTTDRGSKFPEAAALWCSKTASDGDRLCALMSLAASVAHEMVHLCKDKEHSPSDDEVQEAWEAAVALGLVEVSSAGIAAIVAQADQTFYCHEAYQTGWHFSNMLFIKYGVPDSDCCDGFADYVSDVVADSVPGVDCPDPTGTVGGGSGGAGAPTQGWPFEGPFVGIPGPDFTDPFYSPTTVILDGVVLIGQ